MWLLKGQNEIYGSAGMTFKDFWFPVLWFVHRKDLEIGESR